MTYRFSICHSRWSAWRRTGVLAAMALVHSIAMAQVAPVTLACPTPTSTGVTADLSTAGGVWEIQPPGGAWSSAAATGNPAWDTVAGATWIGNGASGVNGNYTFRRQIDASDPNVDLASLRVTYSYLADNRMESAALGAALPVTPVGFVGQPGSATNQTATLTPDANNFLTFVAYNSEGPVGIAANVTLTFDCRAVVPPAPVPVNAPWALGGLGSLMVLAAALRRRRRA
ncbi:hypothetical protein FVQ98_04045 [Ottowia sp. GY511]|uniref:IPTL-CTERM sorting domain-containing protein n=1 Tax=Ottowia flava TaxID=2675430 RepID=A0ABW4KRA8_9BURK|nr:hypothetical protein [Ottowia sp. GY511]TXK33159.1 hypothetical protein FVQ98_04045 [Ottowia sp. GY511]